MIVGKEGKCLIVNSYQSVTEENLSGNLGGNC